MLIYDFETIFQTTIPYLIGDLVYVICGCISVSAFVHLIKVCSIKTNSTFMAKMSLNFFVSFWVSLPTIS